MALQLEKCWNRQQKKPCLRQGDYIVVRHQGYLESSSNISSFITFLSPLTFIKTVVL